MECGKSQCRESTGRGPLMYTPSDCIPLQDALFHRWWKMSQVYRASKLIYLFMTVRLKSYIQFAPAFRHACTYPLWANFNARIVDVSFVSPPWNSRAVYLLNLPTIEHWS
ncbi:hypothetical protein XU18_0622 [Perkinsela sp. CCAP 1560/4]|nr:hypothetical protein XU18_0622 [Perkinsela sp. CCAP 1560/4]|eukprot:KNH09112.1 hypothetical protein XU18_0622 [Perkinsela sp. CCAP 1560/4]